MNPKKFMEQIIESSQAPESEIKSEYSFIRLVNSIPAHQSYPEKKPDEELSSNSEIATQLQAVQKVEAIINCFNAYSSSVYLMNKMPFGEDPLVQHNWFEQMKIYAEALLKANTLVGLAGGEKDYVGADSDEAIYKLKHLYLGILGTDPVQKGFHRNEFGLFLPQNSVVHTLEITDFQQIADILEDWDGLVHDTRSPLTAITGYAQILSTNAKRRGTAAVFNTPGVQILRDNINYLQRFLKHDVFDYLMEIKGEAWDLARFNDLIEPILKAQLVGEIRVNESQILITKETASYLEDQLAVETDPQKIAEIKQLLERVEKNPNEEFHTPASSSLLSVFKFHSAESLLNAVLANEAWNLPKTFALKQRQRELRSEQSTETQNPDVEEWLAQDDQVSILYTINNSGNLEIILRDNGVGVNDEIERQGFGKRRSAWGEADMGTGIGLDSAARRLSRHKFGSRLQGRSVRKGSLKVGAEIYIEIPADREDHKAENNPNWTSTPFE